MMLGTQMLSTYVQGIQQEAWKYADSPKLSSLADNVASTSTSVYGSCHSAVDVLNGLLLYNKIEDGDMRLRLKTQNLIQSISGWVEPFTSQASEEQICLIYSGDECFPSDIQSAWVAVDNIKFTMVMRNLLSNALKFTAAGGTITVSARLLGREELAVLEGDDPMVRITVKDTGCGILPENQSKLFKDMVQFSATEARNGEGSGLGLYVSRNIVSKHGGLLTLESSGISGEGCSFHVDLPLKSNPTDPSTTGNLPITLEKRNSSASSVAPLDFEPDPNLHIKPVVEYVKPSDNNRRRVVVPLNYSDDIDVGSTKFHCALVVDDVKTCRKMLSRALKPHFAKIVEREDGVGAVGAVKESFVKDGIDMIFLDSVMPNMGGIEACKIIRDMGYEGPIIAVTGNIVPEDVEEFLAAGADKLVGKPMRLDTLITTLKEFQPGTTHRALQSQSSRTPCRNLYVTDDIEIGRTADCQLEEVCDVLSEDRVIPRNVEARFDIDIV
eukprot:CAMPEP_0185038082 /NCGR_PEP_ID=MMETSP1103-20130426/33292_1 /TAXON_ID=36769 /ORGANISM="Paraphysomonas bandaiensis, Strain Caron Lab Isolate" /LENGTH=496 /DNA_ID=CAMNT_0027576353 /DNA_START=935 /DNA_END=2426 /DNA_ORIENTATION=+